MEIENSLALGETADEATQTLVAALNADAGPGTWAANPSSSELPPAADMDVITNAIIYKPAAVTRLGEARALGDQSREASPPDRRAVRQRPRADRPGVHAGRRDGDAVHRGRQPLQVEGLGRSLPRRHRPGRRPGRRQRLARQAGDGAARWIPTVQGDVDDVLLLGDFNSYTQEDPLHVLYDEGYVDPRRSPATTSTPTRSRGCRGRSTTCSRTSRRWSGSPGRTSGTSTPSSPCRWSTAGTTTTTPTSTSRGPYPLLRPRPVIVGLSEPTAEPVATSVSATGGPVTFGTDWTAQVTVNPSTATGTVQVLNGNTSLGTATLSSGSADITISGTALQPGDHTLNVRYLGDAEHAPSASTFTVTVNPVKADVRLEADVKPNKVVVDKTRTRVQITVSAPGQKVTGMVRVNWKGKRKTVTLTNGKATVQLGKWGSTGEKHVRVHYLGSDLANPATEVVTFQVRSK